ncbi:MAG: DUF4230 domain-containing protein [Chitinophagales bacterium]|nr:DUF4230 domain-containing protein [Chitinophagales bacterium]
MIRKIVFVIAILAAFGLGVWLTSSFLHNKAKETTTSGATVLLEQVKQVRKMVTVEGNFSELYDETNIRNFTIYLPMPSTWSFSKQATLKVTGKVLVGYDLKEIQIRIDSTNHQLILSKLPDPEIISVDHQLEYKNLEESYFNSFSPEDYTRISKNAKAVLSEKAKESGLLEKAAEQGNQMIDIMRVLVEAAGWTLLVEEESGQLLPFDSLSILD